MAQAEPTEMTKKYPPEYPTARLLDEAPIEAARRVRAALRESGGLIESAAVKLFVSPRTFRRWIKRLRDGGHAIKVRARGYHDDRHGKTVESAKN